MQFGINKIGKVEHKQMCTMTTTRIINQSRRRQCGPWLFLSSSSLSRQCMLFLASAVVLATASSASEGSSSSIHVLRRMRQVPPNALVHHPRGGEGARHQLHHRRDQVEAVDTLYDEYYGYDDPAASYEYIAQAPLSMLYANEKADADNVTDDFLDDVYAQLTFPEQDTVTKDEVAYDPSASYQYITTFQGSTSVPKMYDVAAATYVPKHIVRHKGAPSKQGKKTASKPGHYYHTASYAYDHNLSYEYIVPDHSKKHKKSKKHKHHKKDKGHGHEHVYYYHYYAEGSEYPKETSAPLSYEYYYVYYDDKTKASKKHKKSKKHDHYWPQEKHHDGKYYYYYYDDSPEKKHSMSVDYDIVYVPDGGHSKKKGGKKGHDKKKSSKKHKSKKKDGKMKGKKGGKSKKGDHDLYYYYYYDDDEDKSSMSHEYYYYYYYYDDATEHETGKSHWPVKPSLKGGKKRPKDAPHKSKKGKDKSKKKGKKDDHYVWYAYDDDDSLGKTSLSYSYHYYYYSDDQHGSKMSKKKKGSKKRKSKKSKKGKKGKGKKGHDDDSIYADDDKYQIIKKKYPKSGPGNGASKRKKLHKDGSTDDDEYAGKKSDKKSAPSPAPTTPKTKGGNGGGSKSSPTAAPTVRKMKMGGMMGGPTPTTTTPAPTPGGFGFPTPPSNGDNETGGGDNGGSGNGGSTGGGDNNNTGSSGGGSDSGTGGEDTDGNTGGNGGSTSGNTTDDSGGASSGGGTTGGGSDAGSGSGGGGTATSGNETDPSGGSDSDGSGSSGGSDSGTAGGTGNSTSTGNTTDSGGSSSSNGGNAMDAGDGLAGRDADSGKGDIQSIWLQSSNLTVAAIGGVDLSTTETMFFNVVDDVILPFLSSQFGSVLTRYELTLSFVPGKTEIIPAGVRGAAQMIQSVFGISIRVEIRSANSDELATYSVQEVTSILKGFLSGNSKTILLDAIVRAGLPISGLEILEESSEESTGDGEPTTKETNNKLLYISIGCVAAALALATVVVLYVRRKRHEQEVIDIYASSRAARKPLFTWLQRTRRPSMGNRSLSSGSTGPHTRSALHARSQKLHRLQTSGSFNSRQSGSLPPIAERKSDGDSAHNKVFKKFVNRKPQTMTSPTLTCLDDSQTVGSLARRYPEFEVYKAEPPAWRDPPASHKGDDEGPGLDSYSQASMGQFDSYSYVGRSVANSMHRHRWEHDREGGPALQPPDHASTSGSSGNRPQQDDDDGTAYSFR